MKEPPVSAEQLPTHIAIIMDGNGRWAESRGLERAEGHEAGAKTVSSVVQRCAELGIPYLTLYSFSTENWTRPTSEVDALMELLMIQLTTEVEQLVENGIRLVHYGSRSQLSNEVLQAIDKACATTADGRRLTLGLALDYSGRSELLHAIKQLISDQVSEDDVVEASLEQRLYTTGTPDPDLLIRTAGEMRISNFLLWQIAYTEIYVTKKNWPEFDSDNFDAAIVAFANRTRKFGSVK